MREQKRRGASIISQSLDEYANRSFAFFIRYIRRRPVSHGAILICVLGAVGFSTSTQYAIKFMVDTLSKGQDSGVNPWIPFTVLVSFIACDNFLWRIASWIASYAFVGVTGDLRSDLFRYLTGHAPSYFAERLPGVLTSRITATSNAVFTVENMFVWNVLPPCVATVAAIAYMSVVSIKMTAFLVLVAGAVMVLMFKIAAAGRPLHHDFADKAAAVDGEMIDVIGNMNLVKAFGGIPREHLRFDLTVGRELIARRRSLQYLEKMRLLHAFVVVVMTCGLVGWAVMLWKEKQITTGDVIFVATLGISVLSATRDLAVALVDVTQHLARLSEALRTLLTPYQMTDHPEAAPLIAGGAELRFENVTFAYPTGRTIFDNLTITIKAGQRVGLVGPSGGGKSTLIALLQRFYDIQGGRILIDGQDISRITESSLRDAMAIVPQDTALLNRSLADNIRYGRPDAADDEVWAAAIAAKCRPFIENLPDGLETPVGDRGTKLSGGQRQRIAIARAFLKNAPILLLDEATSALDSESEEAIRQALERLMVNRTVLTVAHRLSTLRGFDRILVLRGGQVVQDGPPDELMRVEGPYRDLINEEVSRLAPQAAA